MLTTQRKRNNIEIFSFDDDFISTLAFDVMVRLETNMPIELRITKMAFVLETDDTVKRAEVRLKNRPTRFPRQHRQESVFISLLFSNFVLNLKKHPN